MDKKKNNLLRKQVPCQLYTGYSLTKKFILYVKNLTVRPIPSRTIE